MSKFVDALSSAAGSGVIGLAGNVLGGLFNDPTERSKEMMDYQYKLQRGLVDLQAKYNSPANIASEYAKAGFNPYVSMGQGAGSSGGQSSGGSVAIPESAYNTISPQIGVLSSEMLRNFATALKTSKESSVVKPIAESEVAKNVATADEARASADLKNIEALFEKRFGAETRKGHIAELRASVAEKYQHANELMAAGNLHEAEQAVKELQYFLNETFIKQENEKLQMLGIELKNLPNKLKEELNVLRTQASANVASAEESRASAEEHRSSAKEHEEGATLKMYQGLLSQYEYALRQSGSVKEFQNYAAFLEKQGVISSAELAEAQKRLKNISTVNRAYDNDAFVRAIDNFLVWFADKVGIALVGSVSSSSSSVNK